MKIRNHDKARLRRNASANFRWIDGPAVLFDAPEPLHVRLQIMRDIENWAVGRMLYQNFVARFDDRSHGQMIRHGRARRFHDAVGIHTVVRGDGLLQRCIAVAVVAVDFELLQIYRQVSKRKWHDAARCKVEPRAAPRFGPMHVIGMLVFHDNGRSESGNQETRKKILKNFPGFVGSRLNPLVFKITLPWRV